MVKNILLITQEYPADDIEKEFTPVVHYFTKEWVIDGYNVVVLNLPTNFPYVYYYVTRFLRRKIESWLGINIRMYTLSERKYELDGVKVFRYPLKKYKPHGRFPKRQIFNCINATICFCRENSFQPDIMIGHWTNPAIDVMLGLKHTFHVPYVQVMHDYGFDFKGGLKEIKEEAFRNIDCWGFRSYPIKRKFESYYGVQKNSFMCFSGVPDSYIKELKKRNFSRVHNFLFVGLLMERKHPYEFVRALHKSMVYDFRLDIVGQGDEASKIEQYINNYTDLQNKINLCGRISREEVSNKMQIADVFCMISERETYGLVYLEAMANGCITIASRNEGFDGIIVDGENGFLCEAGNIEELTSIINKINKMDKVKLNHISENAIKTASQMTDSIVAASYIHDIEKLLNI